MRRTDGCVQCGEVREIAGKGLCFKCYRQAERAADRQFAGVDRHNPGIRREHKKVFRGFTAVMAGLSDLGVELNDALAIRRILEPYIVLIAKFLAPAPEQEKRETEVNSERNSQSLFTVHTGAPAEGTAPEVHPTGASDGNTKAEQPLRESGKLATKAASSKLRHSNKGKRRHESKAAR
jgi:hypothetical protein